MTYLVDTDYVADYLKGQRNVVAILEPLLPEGIAMSIITFAEVYEGYYKNENIVQKFMSTRFPTGIHDRSKEKYYKEKVECIRNNILLKPCGN